MTRSYREKGKSGKTMTCKIERVDSGKNAFVLIVSGRLETEHVSAKS